MSASAEATQMETRIIKTIFSADGERRLQSYERDDGWFNFIEDMRVYDGGTPAWTPLWPPRGPICESKEVAEREAAARVAWLNDEISN